MRWLAKRTFNFIDLCGMVVFIVSSNNDHMIFGIIAWLMFLLLSVVAEALTERGAQ